MSLSPAAAASGTIVPRRNNSVPYLSLRADVLAACKTLANMQSAARAARRVVPTIRQGAAHFRLHCIRFRRREQHWVPRSEQKHSNNHEPSFTFRRLAARESKDCCHNSLQATSAAGGQGLP